MELHLHGLMSRWGDIIAVSGCIESHVMRGQRSRSAQLISIVADLATPWSWERLGGYPLERRTATRAQQMGLAWQGKTAGFAGVRRHDAAGEPAKANGGKRR
jgi:hypothetical protein